jgi:hypothetical protein
MEKIEDFDNWFSHYKLPPVKFVAVFNPDTGAVISVGPSHAFKDQKHKISVDKEMAESIINAEIKIDNCVVDMNSNTLEVAEIKSVYKIDDVLHRVISKKDSEIKKPDIYIKYDSKLAILKIEMSTEFGGTRKARAGIKKRKIVWDGDTEMQFFITEYNDPNLLFRIVSVTINDLIGKCVLIEGINYPMFSVYTRRLFKNYVIDYR